MFTIKGRKVPYKEVNGVVMSKEEYDMYSDNENIIGVYLTLNDDLVPAIRVRYASPLTEDELWGLMTKETWTITYTDGTVKDEAAKIGFDTKGTVAPFVETEE